MQHTTAQQHTAEIASRSRFEFGSNWARYVDSVDERRIELAKASLCEMLGVEDLRGRSFIDIGSGSGLFSLAAHRLGAKVCSLDYDPLSVACTESLKARFHLGDKNSDAEWQVLQASVLDTKFLATLGQWDIVYSWGVLHHTGDMYTALRNIVPLVKASGTLFVAIYNDQGRTSRLWLRIKRFYNRLPKALRWVVLGPIFLRLWGPTTLSDFLRGRPFHTWRHYSDESVRGMSPWRDVVDWVGGLPFEVAKPEEIFDLYRAAGFELMRMRTCAGGIGCNEFVFQRGAR